MAKVRSSVVGYRAEGRALDGVAGPLRAKVFANGRSQAVRLPKAFRFSCAEVLIRQEGTALILEPVPPDLRDAKGWRIGLWDELAAWREGLDLDEFQIEDDPIPAPIIPMDAD